MWYRCPLWQFPINNHLFWWLAESKPRPTFPRKAHTQCLVRMKKNNLGNPQPNRKVAHHVTRVHVTQPVGPSDRDKSFSRQNTARVDERLLTFLLLSYIIFSIETRGFRFRKFSSPVVVLLPALPSGSFLFFPFSVTSSRNWLDTLGIMTVRRTIT